MLSGVQRINVMSGRAWIARTILALFVLIPALPLAAQNLRSEPRYALVIGQRDYPAELTPLLNTVIDAEKVALALERTGFKVVMLKNATGNEIRSAVSDLSQKMKTAPGASVGFFYYSGHGVNLALSNGGAENSIIPIDALANDLERTTIRVSEVIDALSATRGKAAFVVIDACRDLSKSLGDSGGVRSKGLAAVRQQTGLYIAYSTAENKVAPDDGHYAIELAQQLVQPEQTHTQVFTNVQRSIAGRRRVGELPFTSDALTSEFCFVSCPGAPGSGARVSPQAATAKLGTVPVQVTDNSRDASISGDIRKFIVAGLPPDTQNPGGVSRIDVALSDRPITEGNARSSDFRGVLQLKVATPAGECIREFGPTLVGETISLALNKKLFFDIHKENMLAFVRDVVSGNRGC